MKKGIQIRIETFRICHTASNVRIKIRPLINCVVYPDPNLIRIQKLCGSGPGDLYLYSEYSHQRSLIVKFSFSLLFYKVINNRSEPTLYGQKRQTLNKARSATLPIRPRTTEDSSSSSSSSFLFSSSSTRVPLSPRTSLLLWPSAMVLSSERFCSRKNYFKSQKVRVPVRWLKKLF